MSRVQIAELVAFSEEPIETDFERSCFAVVKKTRKFRKHEKGSHSKIPCTNIDTHTHDMVLAHVRLNGETSV